ncbi:MAG TPA: hypothetical protein ENJ29_15035 [Bacteroidetes bacterium]|nr:hypothetical protein [Bacteroidota bacterium]
MTQETLTLSITAASIGFIHTLLGPDHYIPFVSLGKARNWSIWKTLTVTALSGLGHVLSSVVLGFIGIAFGVMIFKLEAIESMRGSIAAWSLIFFGMTYFAWGMYRILRGKGHSHCCAGGHSHEEDKKELTAWALFIIFVLGPCEPLIPLLIYPAAQNSMSSVIIVTLIFGVVTILTMMGAVLALSLGVSRLSLGPLTRYAHPLAGLIIAMSGIAVEFLGL